MSRKCMDYCDGILDAVYDDPRDPPIDECPCLCSDCYRNAIEELLQDHKDAVEDLKLELKRLPR